MHVHSETTSMLYQNLITPVQGSFIQDALWCSTVPQRNTSRSAADPVWTNLKARPLNSCYYEARTRTTHILQKQAVRWFVIVTKLTTLVMIDMPWSKKKHKISLSSASVNCPYFWKYWNFVRKQCRISQTAKNQLDPFWYNSDLWQTNRQVHNILRRHTGKKNISINRIIITCRHLVTTCLHYACFTAMSINLD